MPETSTIAAAGATILTAVVTAGASVAKAWGTQAKLQKVTDGLAALETRLVRGLAAVRAELTAADHHGEIQRIRDALAEARADISALEERIDARESAEGDERATLAEKMGGLSKAIEILLSQKRGR